MEVALKSITGRVREKDEDSVFGATCTYAGQDTASERSVLSLADGMGGGGAGEVASGMLVSAVRKHVVPLMFEDSVDDMKVAERMQTAVEAANKEILEYAAKTKIETMGTTAVIAFVEGAKITVANVGDSRLYVVNDRGIRQLTKDDSLVQELYEKGQITRDQMRKHPKKNLITKAVGLEEGIEAQVTYSKVFEGDRILLCCDGLWESMPDADLSALAMEPDIKKAVDRLVEDANTLDGTDNISLVLGVPSMAGGEHEYSEASTRKIASPPAPTG
jgi:protein phosphatase